MTVAYFDESRARTESRGKTETPAARTTPGFWGRLLDRIIETRMRQAEAELARHRHIARFEPNSPGLVSIWHLPLGD